MSKFFVYLNTDNHYLRTGIEGTLGALHRKCRDEFEIISPADPFVRTGRRVVIFDDSITALAFRYHLLFNTMHSSQCQAVCVGVAGFSRAGVSSSHLLIPCIRAMGVGGEGGEMLSKVIRFRGKSRGCLECPLTLLNNSDKLLLRFMSEAESNAHICEYMELTSKTLSYNKHKIKRLLGMNSIFQLYKFVRLLKSNDDHHRSAS